MKSRFRTFRPPSSRTRLNLSRFQIGTANEAAHNAAALAVDTQTQLATLTEAQFAGTNVKLPGLAKLDLTYSLMPATAGSAEIDVFVIRIPTAIATPTLTGALNWADPLKGMEVLGYKRLLVGTTTVPRIVRIPVRSFPNMASAEDIRVFMVTRPFAAVTFLNRIRYIPKFRVS